MKKITFLLISILSLFAFSCNKNNTISNKNIAVFVPGVLVDSPTYTNLVKGAQEAVEEYNKSITDENMKVKITVVEAGTNQAEWSAKITSLCAEKKFDLIISSNPSLPEIVAPLTNNFPNQKFIIMDASLEKNPNIFCVNYNQKEQTYIAGAISALMSKNHKIALIAAQEYPVMNNILAPYFEKGAQDIIPETKFEFRVVGNWFDASKASEIANALIKTGVDVILPICGGASQGVISSAKENNVYLAYIDDNSYNKLPGKVICSTSIEQDKATKEAIIEFLENKTSWGTTKTLGIRESYIKFIDDDPLYLESVPKEIQNKISNLVENLKSGKFVIPEIK